MDVGDAPGGGIEGHVERLDELFGVTGWAIDRADPRSTIGLELWAGNRLIATARTGGDRADVCAALGLPDARPGFRFDDGVRDAIRDAALDGVLGVLEVRPAGGGPALPAIGGSRSLELVRLGASGEPPADADALLDRLSNHAQDARGTLDQPLRPLPGRAIGFVEALSADGGGLIWIVGWMQEDPLRDRPIVIVDHGRHAAGFAYTLVARDDLPPGGKGFVGILHTDWRATSDVPPHLFLADGSLRYLETLHPTPLRGRQALVPVIRDLLARAEDMHRELLRELFHSAESWSPDDPRAAADMVQLDEVAVLPGFGLLAKGWALSPSKEVARLVLKAGNRIVVAEPRSLARHARPDLASVYPNVDQALENAGFAVTFRGAFEDSRPDEMILKATWHDGSSSHRAVDPAIVRTLGMTAPIESVRRFYPAVEAESFFPDFAFHAARGAQARARDVQPYELRTAPAAIVLAAPATASDLFLTVDRAIRHARHLPAGWGIAIVARGDLQRSLLLSLFADLRRSVDRPCSLFLTGTGEPTTDALAMVLDALGAARFAFVGADAVLSEAGWRAIGNAPDGLTLLSIRDPAAPGADASAGLSAFAADRPAWQALVAGAAPRIGGIALRAGPHRVIADGALSLGRRRESPLVARINQAIGSDNG